jgi:APA family basic amino acid/polyamine antiporter
MLQKYLWKRRRQAMEKKKSEFDKVLGAWDILVIAFGAMIGWGWVVSTGSWIEKGGVIGAALGFIIGGIMIFFVGMTYAELTAAMPQCGGEHVFSYRAMGAVGSFICTWMIVLGYVSVACFEACAFPTIITYLWPGFLKGYLYTVAGFDIYASWLIVAIVLAFIIMVINILGAKTAAILQTILTCIIGGAGILLIVASIINGSVDNMSGQMFTSSNSGVNIKAIIGVASLSPFYFIGFDVIPQAAEEINVPAKKIGKILILSVVLAVIFYSLIIIAVGFVMNPQAISDSQNATGLVTADAMAAAFNTKIMAKVIIVGGMCGIVTSWNSFLLGGSRAMYSMAESYMIPKFFAKLHPKYKTPVNALILIGILTMLAPFAGRKMLVWISDAGNFGCCVAYCMVALSFIILRKKEPDMPRPYKVPAYRFFGIMAVIMSGFMVAMYCIPGSGGTLIVQEWGIVFAWCALGVVFYIFCKNKYQDSFGILVELISDEDAASLMPEADEPELDKVIDEAIDRTEEFFRSLGLTTRLHEERKCYLCKCLIFQYHRT